MCFAGVCFARHQEDALIFPTRPGASEHLAFSAEAWNSVAKGQNASGQPQLMWGQPPDVGKSWNCALCLTKCCDLVSWQGVPL